MRRGEATHRGFSGEGMDRQGTGGAQRRGREHLPPRSQLRRKSGGGARAGEKGWAWGPGAGL